MEPEDHIARSITAPLTPADVDAWYPDRLIVDVRGRTDGAFPPFGDGDHVIVFALPEGRVVIVLSRRHGIPTHPDGTPNRKAIVNLALRFARERSPSPVFVSCRPVARRVPRTSP